jgi:DNA-binding Lrp family transcriptional regulator
MEFIIDDIDKQILNVIQSQFPVESRPYDALAKQFSIPEEEVHKRIDRLRSKRIIRRIGAVFDSSKLGFSSTLIGVKVNPLFLEKIAKKINELSGITHHYQREDDFNLWFTLTTKDLKIIDQTIHKVKGWEGVLDILNLPSTRTFKIKVDFQV